jgi:hypothetical protein
MEAKDGEAEDSPEAVEEENDEEAASKVPDERQQHGVIHRNVVCPYHRSNIILNYMCYATVNISMPTRSI